jgi:acyl-CoA thioester hydrolase
MSKITWSVPIQHSIIITVEPKHVDMFKHANNAWYVAWAMDCAWAHSDALGLDFAAYEEAGVGCVVREHRFTYLAPAHEGDEIAVGTWIKSNDGKLRLTRGFELRRVADNKLLVEGETQFVCIDIKTGRPTRMPAAYAAKYAVAEAAEG